MTLQLLCIIQIRQHAEAYFRRRKILVGKDYLGVLVRKDYGISGYYCTGYHRTRHGASGAILFEFRGETPRQVLAKALHTYIHLAAGQPVPERPP